MVGEKVNVTVQTVPEQLCISEKGELTEPTSKLLRLKSGSRLAVAVNVVVEVVPSATLPKRIGD